MGAARSGRRAEGRLRTLIPDRLFGRRRGHTLRARQQTLLDATLPRLRFDPGDLRWRAQFGVLWLEIGFGGGEHARAMAERHPEAGLIGCEVFITGICSLLGHLVPLGEEASAPLPSNLRVWDDDARTLLRTLPGCCLDGLFLLFPDPWPKTRHARRRFVSPETIDLAAHVLKPGAMWRIASDDPVYQDWVTGCLDRQTAFDVAPPAQVRPDGWPATRYEAKALRAGRAPLYWSLIRRAVLT